jgi:Cu/Ag efflux protein CusF
MGYKERVRAPALSRSVAAAAALAALAAACQKGPAGTPAAVHRYVVRGELARLPARAGDEVMVRHEAIPDFRDREGAVVGMDAMVMGFQVTPDVPLAGLQVGDKVRLAFAVDWARPSLTVERIERLPPDTELRFEKAPAPPGR